MERCFEFLLGFVVDMDEVFMFCHERNVISLQAVVIAYSPTMILQKLNKSLL